MAAPHRPMRWYNPKLEDFEWREVPNSDEEALSLIDGYPSCDEEALSLIDGYPSCEPYAEVYKEWRKLGAGVMAALIRAGDVAREQAN